LPGVGLDSANERTYVDRVVRVLVQIVIGYFANLFAGLTLMFLKKTPGSVA
jgi:hypothetical protein